MLPYKNILGRKIRAHGLATTITSSHTFLKSENIMLKPEVQGIYFNRSGAKLVYTKYKHTISQKINAHRTRYMQAETNSVFNQKIQ